MNGVVFIFTTLFIITTLQLLVLCIKNIQRHVCLLILGSLLRVDYVA